MAKTLHPVECSHCQGVGAADMPPQFLRIYRKLQRLYTETGLPVSSSEIAGKQGWKYCREIMKALNALRYLERHGYATSTLAGRRSYFTPL